ncbi:MAG: peptidylprolyl isomerase [Ignavibacteria bacterium]|nr:peptidylprolyl isomerase [Ignavibacteria bacterium]
MGAISKIRQLSPYALATIAVLFIAFMVMQDCAGNAAFQGPKSANKISVAEINGESISLAEYDKRVANVLEGQRNANPGQDIDDEQIRQQVFDEMINEVLRRQEARKLGLQVTKQELIDVIAYNPPADLQKYMQDSTGRFDKRRWQELVTNPNSIAEQMQSRGASQEEIDKQMQMVNEFLIQIEDQTRLQKLEEALKSAVEATATIVSPTVAERDYITNSSTADIRFVAIPADRIKDDEVKPTDDELQAYYEKNKLYKEQKKSRRLKYVTFPQVPSTKDSSMAQKRSMSLQEAFSALATIEQRDSAFTVAMDAYNGTTNDFKAINDIDATMSFALMSLKPHDVFGPLNVADGIKYVRLDSLREGQNVVARASHILIPFDQSKPAAKKTADSLLRLAKSGQDFSLLARLHSKDPGSAQQGGDLGFFSKGRMVKEFEEAAFNNPVGSIVGPVETQFGYHIIKVTDKQSTEIKFSEINIKPVMSSATKQQIIAKAAQMQKRIEDGAPIDTLAKEQHLKALESPFITSQSPFLGSAELTAWAFEADKGSVIRKDVKYYGLVLAQITDVREAGIKPFEDVKEEIETNVKRIKKLEKVKKLAEQVASACKRTGNIQAYREVDSTLELHVQTGLRNNGQLQRFGNEFAATNAAFTQPLKTVSDLIKGNRAWFVLTVDARIDADLKAYKTQATQQTQALASQAKGQAYFAWFQKVKENAEIVDKRFSRK